MEKYAYIDEITLITIPLSEVEEELSDLMVIDALTKTEIPLINWEKRDDRWRYEIYLKIQFNSVANIN
ncbi:hypothetical protein H1D32_05720 [Anaerobacillus sp. CMMVII]|uniref:hypothetical protein n=1 Tax=Anaerobacillus sp. CMMVII TaxID=2755588 RepID=UPI0021B7693A|nr:hypothetical protein [Anaerobacillus sp. CMMVII]MCT8137286.1 hypothetical protein [Anaerobacillus sp. CMMVII]